MNTPPSQTPINSASYPTQFQQVILEKSQNFIDRPFIFTAISDFLHRHKRGYFTIVGVPGSGKSAILGKYVTQNSNVVYYNAQVEGKNRTSEFLTTVCTNLVETLYVTSLQDETSLHPIPDNATEGSWFLSLLLQKISDRLEPHQRLIIAIDALDAIDRTVQPPGTNLFYLPRYLPDGVYFILTRRPFKREKSGLLIEVPSQVLDLSEYPEQNREDVQAYIRQYLTPSPSRQAERGVESGDSSHIREEELIARLTTESENNFMYLHHILNAIAEGFYSEPYQFDRIPPGLVAYYQQHWQKIKGEGLSDVALKVLGVLTSGETAGMSAKAITQIIDEDEYDVAEILEHWLEFLQQGVGKETTYSLYHSHFRVWLGKKISNS
ncbi:ATP-binding protein [Scytonema sp. PRP1]|uniref:ATP-binding protein n=1 Tax=Scytonema sp. PRP1 TaxID=3120513 RepID=UPI002FD34778